MEEPDTEGLGEEMEQHRALAAQLREKLQQDQQQLASKEQLNEILKSKLSLIKSRSKAKRETMEKDERYAKTAKDLVDASPRRGDLNLSERNRTQSKSNKGKINVLREQLEQNRLRFERHGQELSEDARSMEAVVEQLRHKLEDSDVTIQQLQAGQLRPMTPSANELVQGDIHSQLAEKEAVIQQLMTQATDSRNTILELQENIKEKDCVIEARTRAITLLSEDMSKKWRANVDMLEETRQQMHIMQENFVRIEAGLNSEIEQLTQQLENKSKKLLQVEQSLKQTESARFDLAARNAELQEKIVSLQEHMPDGSVSNEAQAKIDELSQAVSDANKLAFKLKAEHKAKLKTLNKQIESLRKESGATDEITRLQNCIVILEEEKGAQAQELHRLKKSVMELQNLNVAAEVRVVEVEEQVGSGNIKQVLAELKMKLEDRDRDIETLKEKLSTAEMRCKDHETSINSEMQCELAEARCALKDWEARCQALEMELKEHQKVLLDLRQLTPNTKLESCVDEDICMDTGSTIQALQLALNEKESCLDRLKDNLKVLQNDMQSKVEYLERSFYEKHVHVQELEAMIHAKLKKIQIDYENSPASCQNCKQVEEWRTLIAERDNHIQYLENTVKNMEINLEDHNILQSKFSEISQELALVREQCVAKSVENTSIPETLKTCDLCQDTASIKIKLIELSGELQLKLEECNRLENKLKSQDEKLKKIAVSLKVKTMANKDLEDRVCKFEKVVQANEACIEELSREKHVILEKWQTEISEKNTAISEAVKELEGKNKEIEILKDNLGSKTLTISEMASTIDKLQAQVEHLKSSLKVTSESLEEVTIAHRETQVSALEIASLRADLNLLQDGLSKEVEEKQSALTKLESLAKTAKIKLAREKKIRLEMQEKQGELEALLAEKTNALAEIHEMYKQEIAKLQQETKSLEEALFAEKTNALAEIHEMHKQEIGKLQQETKSSEEALLAEKTNALAEIHEMHKQEIGKLHQEMKSSEEALLAEKTNAMAEMHEMYKEEIAKIQQETTSLEERLPYREKLVPETFEVDTIPSMHEYNNTSLDELIPPSLENFQAEVEFLCLSLGGNSVEEILPALEEEKMKTLGELQSRFESIHSQIVARYSQRPDFYEDRKLFFELQNLVTRVTNKTVALENKIKSIVIESKELYKKKLEACSDIQTNKTELSKEQLVLKEPQLDVEHILIKPLEERIRTLSEEKWELEQQLQEQCKMSSNLERSLEHLQQKVDEFPDAHALVLDVQHKEEVNFALKSQCEELDSKINGMQIEIQLKETTIEFLKEDIQKAESIMHTLQTQIQLKESTIQELQTQAQEMQTKAQEQQAVVNTLQAEIQELLLHSQETSDLRSRLLDVQEHNTCLEQSVEKLRGVDESLSQARQENELFRSRLQETEQHLERVVFECSDKDKQLHEALQKAANLEHEVKQLMLNTSELKLQLSLSSETCSDLKSLWSNEKEEYGKTICELNDELKTAQHLLNERESLSLSNDAEQNVGESECLRQQLAQKSAEVENYQRRLIQLQMGGSSNAAPSIFGSESEQDSSAEVAQLHSKVEELQQQLSTKSSRSFMDAFNPVSSIFGSPPETSELNIRLADVSTQLEELRVEKHAWLEDRRNMDENIHNMSEQLVGLRLESERAQVDLECLGELRMQIDDMSAEMKVLKDCADQVPTLEYRASEMSIEVEELQSKFKEVQLEKEKAKKECALLLEKVTKRQASIEVGEERPRIPRTLDTHVSTLQTDDSEYYDEEKCRKFIHGTMDESLMEQNITQLESELTGMVTSQLERNTTQTESNADSWDWDGKEKDKTGSEKGCEEELVRNGEQESLSENKESLQKMVHNLKVQLKEMESERHSALSQVSALQAELKQSLQKTADQPCEARSTQLADTSLTIDQSWAEEDSWGWGADNAKIEEEFHHKKRAEEPKKDAAVDELLSKIASLESEKELLVEDKLKLSDDLKASQIRAAKLTRKLKELKTKYDEIVDKKRSTESDNLDQAIEEERQKQIQNLEKELKDVRVELSTIRAERDKLLKQVEVFSSANERLLEAKVRQDVEVEMWQKRSKDLTNQVQALEWRIEELEMGKPDQETDMTGDAEIKMENSETQSCSSDTLNPVAVGQLLKENHAWNASYETLMQEYQRLRAHCLAENEQRTQVDALVAQQKDVIERLEHEKTYLQDVCESLKMDCEAASAHQLASSQDDQKHVDGFAEKMNTNEKNLNETIERLNELSTRNRQLQEQYDTALEERRELLLDLEQASKDLSTNTLEIAELKNEIISLKQNQTDNNMGRNNNVSFQEDFFTAREAINQDASPSSVLNWDRIVPENPRDLTSVDVFETIASISAQSLQEQLSSKEVESQKDKRMIMTLKHTHEEAEQEWSQMIEYHKIQLEAAKKTIEELQMKVNVSQNAPNVEVASQTTQEEYDLIQEIQNRDTRNQQSQSFIFSKEKEIESLQINLAVSEEARRMLENEIKMIRAELESDPRYSSSELKGPDQLLASSPTDVSASADVSHCLIDSKATQSTEILGKELDLALNTLHLRDVRIDELTLELTRLLSERDTLQLRLSNEMRSSEELRDRLTQALPNVTEALPLGQNSALVPPPSDSSFAAQPLHPPHLSDHQMIADGNSLGLERKLAELHQVGYIRDKWLREDSELRHQQMQLLYPPNASAQPTMQSAHGVEVPNPGLRVNLPSAVISSTDDILVNSSANAHETNESGSNEMEGSLLDWFWGRR